MNSQPIADRLRVWPWLLGALLTTAIVGLIAPHQLGVLVWSLSKLSLGAYLGYWIDRSVFNYGRPGDLCAHGRRAEESLRWTVAKDAWLNFRSAMLRRAIVMAAAILALGLGV